MAIYMWRETPYTPTANTMIYMPIDGDLTNYGSQQGSYSGGVIDGNSVIVDNRYLVNDTYLGGESYYGTYSIWVKTISYNGSDYSLISLNTYDSQSLLLTPSGGTLSFISSASSGTDYILTINNPSQRNHICVVNVGTHYVYINGTQVLTKDGLAKFGMRTYIMNTSKSSGINAKRAFGEFIFTTDVWGGEQVLNYYNKSKSKYGIS